MTSEKAEEPETRSTELLNRRTSSLSLLLTRSWTVEGEGEALMQPRTALGKEQTPKPTNFSVFSMP